jgi:hypothetical protein
MQAETVAEWPESSLVLQSAFSTASLVWLSALASLLSSSCR